jgi:signal transduction histidine kinase
MAVAGGATRVLVAAAIMTYLTCLMLIARNKERSVVGTLSLQLQNVDLVASLTEARDTAVSAMRQAENANLAMAEMITELDRSRREAEEANRSKSRFLAVMSHELRTPLNAIIGFSDIMTTQVLGPVGNPRYLEYAADIRTSGLHLLALINNVLDLSKVEAGKFELFEEDVQISAVVATAVKLVSRQASEHGILMEVAVDPEIIIRADERALKQIAINLLSNAVKFCRDGGRVRVVAGSTEEGGVKLSVSDTGIGIAAKNIERALTPFSQIDEPVTRKSAGSGLGLALVKSLTELHGGRLIIDSVVGSGTTVRCLFPPSRVAGRRAA